MITDFQGVLLLELLPLSPYLSHMRKFKIIEIRRFALWKQEIILIRVLSSRLVLVVF